MHTTPGQPQCRRAALAVLALGIYLEAMEWIDFYPWNNIRAGNGQATLDVVIAGVLSILIAWLWWGGRIPALLSAGLIGLWGYFQIVTWWIPYIEGASSGWKKVYAKWFAGSTQILPASPDHLPPDANHFVLQLFVLLAFLLSASAAVAAFSSASSAHSPRPLR